MGNYYKKIIRKIEAPNLEEVLEINNFIPLPITITHALNIIKLPSIHDDLFDRLLIAQAKLEKLTLITMDPKIIKYDIAIIEA